MSHRNQLLPNCFETDYHTVTFRPGECCWVDTMHFTRLVPNNGLSNDDTPLIECQIPLEEGGRAPTARVAAAA